MLTFISYWRAAAVVLNDLASTAYYIGGIAEEAIGKAAPWFILLVMLFATCVRAVYIESCSMFVRGGVYRIVKEAMGSTMAKVSVSALVFDYILTGPISSVSAGQYLHGLFQNLFRSTLHIQFPIPDNLFAMLFALSVTAYFWWLNIKGIEESSHKALRIMQVTTVMVVCILIWSLVTMALHHKFHLPPMKPVLTQESLGWLRHVPWLKTVGLAVFLVSFGHSILAMSGEETLAQVYREIEAPKHRNLFRAAIVILVYSLTFTAFVSFAAVMIIPDLQRAQFKDNLINGLVLNMAGPQLLKLVMQTFVVGVGALILSGAVNTSMIGSNGVLNRVAEDGVLHDWFRHPHRRFGTSYRIINLITALQVLTILISRGDVYLLGEAYAFGVVWSFTFMSLAMLLLRFKYKGERGWKVPLNFKIGGKEIPVGLGLVATVLVCTAVTNLFTKEVATISGVGFTAGFFIIFTASEWHTRRAHAHAGDAGHVEKFIVENKSELVPQDLHLPQASARVLVPVRDPNNLIHLRTALEEAHERGSELIVMTVKVERGDQSFQHIFTKEEQKLFTCVVELAEKYGERITPLVVPSNDSWFAIARTADELQADEIVLGKSNRIPEDVQLEQIAVMRAMTATNPDKELKIRIVGSPDDILEVTI